MMFHSDVETLHQEVPKEILPEELGGDQGKFDNSENFKEFVKMEDTFKTIQGFALNRD